MASHEATMHTVRQVKTVFIIFVAFVSCWTPYALVLLCDGADRLPLPVHLYASMIAHLHASLNFAIYGLMNRNVHAGFAAYLLTRLQRTTLAHSATYDSCPAAVQNAIGPVQRRCVYDGGDARSLVSAEFYQLQQTAGNIIRRYDRQQATSV